MRDKIFCFVATLQLLPSLFEATQREVAGQKHYATEQRACQKFIDKLLEHFCALRDLEYINQRKKSSNGNRLTVLQ